jgi:multidrug efflux pump subunit AcrA (membrane-fusion protein)
VVFVDQAGTHPFDELRVAAAVQADGKATPSSRLQKNQNLEGGIVAKLFVHAGQIVEIGTPLLRLNDTHFHSRQIALSATSIAR